MSRKKGNTKEKLINSSIDLFAEKWYETLSIVEICRNAEVSNGVFYRYFKDKKEIFEFILNDFITNFEEELKNISGNTVEERLKSFFDILILSGKKYKRSIIIYREGQYRFPIFESKLRNLYICSLEKVFERKINETEYLFIVSGIRFLNIRSIFTEINYNIPEAFELVKNGFFLDEIKNFEFIFSEKFVFEEKKSVNSAKEKLLESGIKLFGDKGYFNVNIHDITNDAGYAVGTFYQNFKSKVEFMSEIIEIIGKNVRKFLRLNSFDKLNRTEKELRGIFCFIKFFNDNLNYYEIVREAEFIVNEKVIEYYNLFEKGYIKNLENIKIKDKKTTANMLMGISHYLGIEYLFQNKIDDIKTFLKDLSVFFNKGINYK